MSDVPIKIVGSNVYGRYPVISDEQTINMFVSDEWLVPFAGYAKVVDISNDAEGRGLFVSTRSNKMFAVIGNGVYLIDSNLAVQKIGELKTFSGDVFIDENDTYQIGFCDKQGIYIYNYNTGNFSRAVLDFVPGYIKYQDGAFIAPDVNTIKWRLSEYGNGLIWQPDSPNIGLLQSKPDSVMACIPIPSRMGSLFVMGKTVTEHWVDTGAQLFPYQRTSGFNIDYGCINQTTIATGDTFVIWLGVNEKSGAVIMYSNGSDYKQISTDGINFKLSKLSKPEDSYGFLFKQDGHLFYILTFISDNYSLLYDFNTGAFYTLCDKDMSYFKVKKAVSFNNTYYFINHIDGNIYELNSQYTDFNGEIIPRVRVCDTLRMPDNKPFITNRMSLLIEQGHSDSIQCIDLSLSRNNAHSFGNYLRYEMNTLGDTRSRCNFYRLGRANALTPQFRFWGKGRFVVGNAIASIYQ